jgi:hypothetical protein
MLAFDPAHDRLDNLVHGRLSHARCGQKLFGSLLCTRQYGSRLTPRPLERLLDLGSHRVRQLGGLVPRLLDESRGACLRLAAFLARFAVRVGQELTGLFPGRVQRLGTESLALATEALDLALLLAQFLSAFPNLRLRPAELRCRRALGVALDHVGKLSRLPDQMERIHPQRVPGRLDVGCPPCRLEHTQLRLELDDVATERVERLADALLVEALLDDRQVLDPGEWRYDGLLRCASGILSHRLLPLFGRTSLLEARFLPNDTP